MEETISKDNILISHKKAAQERRLQKKRELDRAYYLQNRKKKIAQVKQRRQEKRDLPGLDVNSSAIRREIRSRKKGRLSEILFKPPLLLLLERALLHIPPPQELLLLKVGQLWLFPLLCRPFCPRTPRILCPLPTWRPRRHRIAFHLLPHCPRPTFRP